MRLESVLVACLVMACIRQVDAFESFREHRPALPVCKHAFKLHGKSVFLIAQKQDTVSLGIAVLPVNCACL
jgi:hypothetical protein